ncbi:hypothetical protein XELAEV_18008566mg [Xenopus laevis]|uniref:THAP-type domain-containing protein n=1 Tax=Xenopus laevis TaxID=8355 RepID=A0A974I6C9_XENLA|nr:hypothetical protein XELAEV_18008566mg [Xenopus laevis]
MPKCFVQSCPHYTGRNGKPDNVILHTFPRCKKQVQVWLSRTGERYENMAEFVTYITQRCSNFRMCSEHFTDDCYITVEGKRRLKENSAPTIFKTTFRQNARVSKKRQLYVTSTSLFAPTPASPSPAAPTPAPPTPAPPTRKDASTQTEGVPMLSAEVQFPEDVICEQKDSIGKDHSYSNPLSDLPFKSAPRKDLMTSTDVEQNEPIGKLKDNNNGGVADLCNVQYKIYMDIAQEQEPSCPSMKDNERIPSGKLQNCSGTVNAGGYFPIMPPNNEADCPANPGPNVIDPSRCDKTVTFSQCVCGKCPAMPTQVQSLCCREVPPIHNKMSDTVCCITSLPDFYWTCLDKGHIHHCYQMANKTLKKSPPLPIYQRGLRIIAYRIFTVWIYGYLGASNRRPIPPCVVEAIRNAFPDPDGYYAGSRYLQDFFAEDMAVD